VAWTVVCSVPTADVPCRVVGAVATADVAGGVIRAVANRAEALVVETVMMPDVTGPVIDTVAARDVPGRVVGAVAGDGDAATGYRCGRDGRGDQACEGASCHGALLGVGPEAFAHRGSHPVALSIGPWS
jgi:hypothetical protein